MRATMRADLTAAIKSRDRVAMTALRSALAAIENAEAISSDQQSVTTEDGAQVAKAALGVGAAEAQRRQLTEAELETIVQSEVDERSRAAAEYERHGRAEHATKLRGEADVLSRYLG